MIIPAAREVLASLGHPDAWKGKPKLWAKAMTAMPKGRLPFLDKAALKRKCVASGIDPVRAELLAPIGERLGDVVA